MKMAPKMCPDRGQLTPYENENKKIIKRAIESNDTALNGFYHLSETALADTSKRLDEDITETERNKLLEQKMEILRMAGEKYTEHSKNNREIIVLSGFVDILDILSVGIRTIILGSEFNTKISQII